VTTGESTGRPDQFFFLTNVRIERARFVVAGEDPENPPRRDLILFVGYTERLGASSELSISQFVLTPNHAREIALRLIQAADQLDPGRDPDIDLT
jgi:hypothetical protein